MELTKQVRNDKPTASEEVVNSTVTKLLYEKKLADAKPDDPELTLKPNMQKTLKTVTVTKRSHNGKWEVSKFSKKGKEAWSCC